MHRYNALIGEDKAISAAPTPQVLEKDPSRVGNSRLDIVELLRYYHDASHPLSSVSLPCQVKSADLHGRPQRVDDPITEYRDCQGPTVGYCYQGLGIFYSKLGANIYLGVKSG